MAADVSNGMEITTLLNSEALITASVVGSTLSFRGQAFVDSQVIEADLVADNGVVHIINKYFLPDSLTLNLLDLARIAPGFSSVSQLLACSGLESELEEEDRRIFGPSDGAKAFWNKQRPISIWSPALCRTMWSLACTPRNSSGMAWTSPHFPVTP
jgi:hypothetical protein